MPGWWGKYSISSGKKFETYFKWLVHLSCKLQMLAHFKQEVLAMCTHTHTYTHCKIFQDKQSNISYNKFSLVNLNHYQLAVSEEN